VSVGQIDGGSSALPETWTQSGDSTFCLGCSRALVGEEAIDAAPETTSPEGRMRIRREALIRFEIDRTPMASDRAIANACHTSLKAIATVRGELAAR
jgi:hypothetical protein